MNKRKIAAVVSLVGLLWPGHANAQYDSPPPSAFAAGSDSISESVEHVNQRVKILERLREVDQESNQKKVDETPVVSASKDGFSLRAPDTSYQLKIKYEGHFDGRYFVGNDTFSTQRQHTLIVRRARPILEARLPGPFFLRFMADFGSGKVEIPDAYIETGFDSRIGLRIGKFKSPFSLEVLQSTAAAPFIELSLSSQLAPNRDIGTQLQGELVNGALTYAAGVFDGVADGSSLDADWNRWKDFSGRVFVQPLQFLEPLKGFGFGAAYTAGNHSDPRDLKKWSSTTVPASVSGLKTAGQESFFKYRDTTVATGKQTRYSLQTNYYLGPFGISGEYIGSTIAASLKGNEKKVANIGWNVMAIYAITGEQNSYKGIKPFRNFDPLKGKWGAFEVAARVSSVRIDNDAFPVLADSTKQARSAIDYTGGINWHLNRNAKVLLNYTQTKFTGVAKSGNAPEEKLLAGRVQIVF
jgi:phosphate-selective porin OprO/OprP